MSLLGTQRSNDATSSKNDRDASPELSQLRSEIEAISRSQAVIEFDTDGTILAANENFLSAVGYQLHEVQGKHHRIFVDPADASKPEYAAFWEKLRNGNADSGEYRRLRKDGSDVWIKAAYNPVMDADSRVVKIVEHAMDVTEAKLQQTESNRLLNMIENMPIAVMYVDRDLVIRYANPASIDLLRKVQHALPIPADSLIGTCIDEFHKNPGHQRALLSDPKNLPISTQIELGGETLSFSVSAILDHEGNHIGAMASGRIMTEEVQTKAKAAEVSNTVATSVAEMVASIDEISQNVSRTANLAQDAEGVAGETTESVESLGESSRKIGEVVGVIQELADQTNLLALNATIEAARAGESGRSFAVVASEVKELANATAKATQNIEQSVREIQESINHVVDSTGRITSSIGEVSANTTTVAAAIEEQSATMASLGETASELHSATTA